MNDDLDFEGYTCPVPLSPKGTIVLGHGSGGKLSHDLLKRLFLPELGKAAPRALDNSAVLTIGGERLALTTDSHVVAPLFFPGGDIGRLAVCGTVNDLAMVGAIPDRPHLRIRHRRRIILRYSSARGTVHARCSSRSGSLYRSGGYQGRPEGRRGQAVHQYIRCRKNPGGGGYFRRECQPW